ncbi:MAG: TAXI family TRAP transporter solute-binding subunit [Gammaproteobacteria bacterium]|uniref:TAXI family TRAP transporter solute-binding subunit n=1 Tax=Rhodoferax sp. TaxID=50421 RepID=UPI0017C42814|nr:TAXI family TRAP transporter solute-binding subunit [Rhodoferax sp.]MBU3900927.1 TAXI family TRAP transporter solute-binding subunit [Gammaproteobacteria bacterium]MBA3057461.1 TAXI family TRAP transporter solute-binding subunit [Rhodoferax sp.]MBU3996844.1 TAXI family TRAP transporter solute-binding subunit [Gammaproteobacteria bacterium]MBU4017601.1 TAXI family TRAP transporter solute-binding subunit [Gammaproteobacteria bacterium]MBU4081044.1 TAXI family TRAP transporter solute-binding s
MKKMIFSALLAAGMLCQGTAANAAVDYKIVTASERGTYIKIGRDLAQLVAPSADINLDALPSAGSAENVRRLRYEPGVKLALVQSDVYQSYIDIAAAGNAAARSLIRPLRVIMPLYNEEIYFIVRADSQLNFIHEIKNARINAGDAGSGTALTSATLYRLMFGEPMPDASAGFLSNEEALAKLVTDKTIDVVAIVAGQPAKLLVDMKPESRQLIKLLTFDPKHPSSEAVLKTYFPANVRASNYPNLLRADLPGLAVKAFLVTYDFQLKDTETHLRQLARSLCQNFSMLQEKGHPKWREVALALPELGRGWFYYAPTAREFRACIAGESKPRTLVKMRSAKQCAQQERILGLCQ